MKIEQLTSAAIVVSVLFGALIAVLAVLDIADLDTVATIGGILLGLMWVVLGVVRRRDAAA